MALTVPWSVDGGLVTLALDVVNNQVRGASATNNDPARTAHITLDRTRGNRTVDVDLAPGETRSVTLPTGQRFTFSSTNPDDPAIGWEWTIGWV